MIVLKALLCAIALAGVAVLIAAGLSRFRAAFEPSAWAAVILAVILSSFALFFFWSAVDESSLIQSNAVIVKGISETLSNLTDFYIEQRLHSLSSRMWWGMGGAVLINILLTVFLVSSSSPRERTSFASNDGIDAYDGFGKDDFDLM